MSAQTYVTAAEACAAWWARQLGAPTYKMTRDDDDIDERDRAGFAEILMTAIASRDPVSREQGEKFVRMLSGQIEELLGKVSWVSLDVDYGPDMQLAEAAQAAGISFSRFPWKTHTTMTRDYVTAALGYGTQAQLIWTSPTWERPPCGIQRYEEVGDDWNPRDEVCSLPKFHDGEHGDWAADTKRCSECSGTYVDHFGPNRGARTHSWNPEAVS